MNLLSGNDQLPMDTLPTSQEGGEVEESGSDTREGVEGEKKEEGEGEGEEGGQGVDEGEGEGKGERDEEEEEEEETEYKGWKRASTTSNSGGGETFVTAVQSQPLYPKLPSEDHKEEGKEEEELFVIDMTTGEDGLQGESSSATAPAKDRGRGRRRRRGRGGQSSEQQRNAVEQQKGGGKGAGRGRGGGWRGGAHTASRGQHRKRLASAQRLRPKVTPHPMVRAAARRPPNSEGRGAFSTPRNSSWPPQDNQRGLLGPRHVSVNALLQTPSSLVARHTKPSPFTRLGPDRSSPFTPSHPPPSHYGEQDSFSSHYETASHSSHPHSSHSHPSPPHSSHLSSLLSHPPSQYHSFR